ncbi:LysR substrate-binding domain-containing protein [Pararhizobium mangrovi]|uniref:HTH-type transcriptional regulator TtuA n=1 Tax=Pararhizobium mangrovi TaxID=2590452 RepID=A0A506U575_9HYPH|nr:LysR substrate-binding domain-containing protein [Pararhizobium mangrovi]TPW27699.1 LysR family transcriptional regulator [Pararhizobium mangrovi]
MDQLAAMRSFVAVVDQGGFAAAGRGLGLSGPMVGNHVRFLEARLGGLLLNRTTRAQKLTELGHAYLARCRRVFAELDVADAEAQEMLGVPRGRLRMTAPHSIGATVLPDIISDFLKEHPAVKIDLHLDDGRLDMLASRFDVAIRVGDLEDAALITRSLAPLELVVCAAPAYLDHRGEPSTLADLTTHDCLDFAGSSTPGTWHFEVPGGTKEAKISGPFQANSGFALRAAALAGFGVVMLPKMLLREDIDSGRLIELLTDFRPQSRPVQLLTLPDRHPAPKLRSFVDAVVRELGPRAGS